MDDRRERISEAVLDLAAAGGNRAVTHGGVDKALGLPKGSTSYYYRSRAELIAAAVNHLTARSRSAFDQGTVQPPTTLAAVAAVIAGQMGILLTDRRRDALARYALLTDIAVDDELHRALATCLFSPILATELFTALETREPSRAATDLIAVLEGILFDHLYGASSLSTSEERGRDRRIEVLVRTCLSALVAS